MIVNQPTTFNSDGKINRLSNIIVIKIVLTYIPSGVQ